MRGLKYYKNNKTSPYKNSQKRKYGYSLAWLHHKRKNKHHTDYWFDYNAPLKAPIIPFNYCLEMVCDRIAIAKVNAGKKYSNMSPYYALWNKTRDNEMLNRHIQGFITETLELLGAYGEKKLLIKNILKNIYNKNIQKEKVNYKMYKKLAKQIGKNSNFKYFSPGVFIGKYLNYDINIKYDSASLLYNMNFAVDGKQNIDKLNEKINKIDKYAVARYKNKTLTITEACDSISIMPSLINKIIDIIVEYLANKYHNVCKHCGESNLLN